MASPRSSASSWVMRRFGAKMNGRKHSRIRFVPIHIRPGSSASMELCKTCRNLPPLSAVRKGSRWSRRMRAVFGKQLMKEAVWLFAARFVAPFCAPAQSKSGRRLNAIDKSVDPCDDFYQYACGGWMKANPIPPDEATWGRFDVLFENNQKILRSILEDAAAHQNAPS